MSNNQLPYTGGVKFKNDLASSIALALVHQMYMPGEYIVKHGDVSKAMYIVDEGKLTRAGGGITTTLNK